MLGQPPVKPWGARHLEAVGRLIHHRAVLNSFGFAYKTISKVLEPVYPQIRNATMLFPEGEKVLLKREGWENMQF